MIHGEQGRLHRPRDRPRLFADAGEPKELWIVPDAKHNRCREMPARGLRRAASLRFPPPARPAPARSRRPQAPASGCHAAGPSPVRRTSRASRSEPVEARISGRGRRGHELNPVSRPDRTSPMFNDPSSELVGLPVANRARRLARTFLEQTGRAARSSASCCWAGSPATPTASSAATTISGEIRTPADFRRRVPIRRLRRPRALHRPRPPGATSAPSSGRGPRS